jgi:hypothetical protein
VVVAVIAVALIGGGIVVVLNLLGRNDTSARPGLGNSRTTSPSPTAKPIVLRPVSGDQLCAAIPAKLRTSLVTDGKYGSNDARTSASSATEKRANCSWTNNKMEVGGGQIGYRTLSAEVGAQIPAYGDPLQKAKDDYQREREDYTKRGEQGGIQGSSTKYGKVRALKGLGDAAYIQASASSLGIKATIRILLGPWHIEVQYGGYNRDTSTGPKREQVEAGAKQYAELIVAEMSKGAGDVKVTGPCGILSVKDVETVLPRAEGPTVGGSDGRIKQKTCTWKSGKAASKPGQQVKVPSGQLTIHYVNWNGGDLGGPFQFDRDAKKYDRYRAKGGIGSASQDIHTDYEARKELSGIGEKAFSVVSRTTRPSEGKAQWPTACLDSAAALNYAAPTDEILVEVLVGEQTIQLTYRGTTTGGGTYGEDGCMEPYFEASAIESELEQLAKTFVTGLK